MSWNETAWILNQLVQLRSTCFKSGIYTHSYIYNVLFGVRLVLLPNFHAGLTIQVVVFIIIMIINIILGLSVSQWVGTNCNIDSNQAIVGESGLE